MKHDHKVHKYERKPLGKKGTSMVMKCVLPGCTHHIAPHLTEGRFSICWRCDSDFVMTKLNTKQKKPHCKACTRSRKPKKEDELTKDSIDLLTKALVGVK